MASIFRCTSLPNYLREQTAIWNKEKGGGKASIGSSGQYKSGKRCSLMSLSDISYAFLCKKECVHYTSFFFQKIGLNPIVLCVLAILRVACFRGIVHNYFDMVSRRLIPMESSQTVLRLLLQLWTCVLIYIVLGWTMCMLCSSGKRNLQQKAWNSSILLAKLLKKKKRFPDQFQNLQLPFRQVPLQAVNPV